MRKPIVAIAASAALLLTGCVAGSGAPPTATAPPATQDWLPAGDLVHRDLAYGTDSNQKLDVYQPQAAQDAPILLMVHGGGWKRGDKAASGVVNNKVSHYLPLGYIVVSTNYRLYPDVDPVTEAGDVGAALAYVQAHAAEWGGSPTNIVLMGHSAGANLVSLLAADPTIASDAGAAPWRGTVALDSAAFNVVTIMSAPHFPLYDPVFGTDTQLWRDSSPTLRLTGAPAPMLLVCDSGRANSCSQANAFAAEVAAKYGKSAGEAIQVYPVDLSHGEINSGLGTAIPLTTAVDAFLLSVAPQNTGLPSG
ncbi:MAG: alpha/beta hydrolase [Microbacteriaceae bacterium]|nr:alpha/beta hydrolase [Microbacteriaceae bacterium]